jgi:hypothetical protein
MFSNIYNFSTRRKKQKYSEEFLSKVSPLAIAKFIMKGGRGTKQLSWRAACAIAEAKIATTYRDLILEEENLNLHEEIIEGQFKEIK